MLQPPGEPCHEPRGSKALPKCPHQGFGGRTGRLALQPLMKGCPGHRSPAHLCLQAQQVPRARALCSTPGALWGRGASWEPTQSMLARAVGTWWLPLRPTCSTQIHALSHGGHLLTLWAAAAVVSRKITKTYKRRVSGLSRCPLLPGLLRPVFC